MGGAMPLFLLIGPNDTVKLFKLRRSWLRHTQKLRRTHKLRRRPPI